MVNLLHQIHSVNDFICRGSLTTFQNIIFYSDKQQNSGCIAPSTKLSAYVSKIYLVYSSIYVLLSGVVNSEDSESRLNSIPLNPSSRYPGRAVYPEELFG
ncbi:hypothetical protein CEXT_30541 [Caerostris extrusa]|uniref:Uncharacterized protein n=1 Tax=Caerostris extrusa TaxID=172846 RepID=A0AAV4MK54_CAEEX|nr:hypothetical protein CEXT_30541 [Caerostris extrusa]